MVAQESILDRVFHILAKAPSPEEILAIHTTEEENQRLEQLALHSKEGKLSVNVQSKNRQMGLALWAGSVRRVNSTLR